MFLFMGIYPLIILFYNTYNEFTILKFKQLIKCSTALTNKEQRQYLKRDGFN